MENKRQTKTNRIMGGTFWEMLRKIAMSNENETQQMPLLKQAEVKKYCISIST